MRKYFFLLFIIVFSITLAGCNKTKVNSNTSQTQNTTYKPLNDVTLCKGDLADFSPTDRDTCNDINATDTNKVSYCDKISNNSRKNICYLKIAKSIKNSEICNRVNNNKLKNACNIYLVEARPDDDIEKSIFLSKKDSDISKQIVDIQTMYAQEGELSQNVLQQHLDIVINKANEKKSAINNNNFNLDEL